MKQLNPLYQVVAGMVAPIASIGSFEHRHSSVVELLRGADKTENERYSRQTSHMDWMVNRTHPIVKQPARRVLGASGAFPTTESAM